MNKNSTVVVSLFLFVITAALYSGAAFFPFCMVDDSDYVVLNTHVTSGLSIESIKWAFATFHASNWHPLTWLSLMLDSQLFGVNPMGFHAINIIFHSLNSVLLFILFFVMTESRWKSAFLAACFAIHPLHVESVVWISERKDVLSFFFLMITLLCYSAYVKQSRRYYYVFSLIAFALGLMAKPMLVTVPVVLLLIDFWPLNRITPTYGHTEILKPHDNASRHLSHVLLEKLPFLLFSAVSCWLTVSAQRDAISTFERLPLLERINNALWSILVYMRKTVLPFDLAIFYPYNMIPNWKAAGALLLFYALTLIVFKYFRKYPYLAVGWFWFLVTLLPVIGLVQVGNQSMADRYTYIPHIGLFTMMIWGGEEFFASVQKKSLIVFAAGGILLFFSISTWIQVGYWRNNVILASHAIEVTNDNYFAYSILGRAYEKLGKEELAIAQYMEALRINSNDADTLVNLGSILNNKGRTIEAISYLQKAVKLAPRLAEAHYGLGSALDKIGSINEAMSEYNIALIIEPNNIMFHNNIGVIFAQQGRLDDAILHFSTVQILSPNDDKAKYNLERAIRQKNQLK